MVVGFGRNLMAKKKGGLIPFLVGGFNPLKNII